jgi:hypothetical protein
MVVRVLVVHTVQSRLVQEQPIRVLTVVKVCLQLAVAVVVVHRQWVELHLAQAAVLAVLVSHHP